MTEPRRIVIAAGGTGGHMFPAQALAEAKIAQGWRVTLSTDARGNRYTSNFPSAVVIEEVSAATFARGGIVAKALVPVKIALGILGAIGNFIQDRPAAVVGFGGYPTIPALSAAWLLRIPRMIHEQNGVLGRVNRIFAPRVNKVACGIWPTSLPKGTEGAHCGNPLRSAMIEALDHPYDPPDASGPLEILVVGGSQGARVLSDVVPEALLALPEDIRNRLHVTQQVRAEDEARVRAHYEGSGLNVDMRPFFEDVAERMARAHLIISRAGASSVAEISAIGRPAILIPFAAAMDDHQTANARGLEQAQAAVVLDEKTLEPGALSTKIAAILTNPGRAEQMARAAKAQGRPDATEQLAGLVEEIVIKRQR